MNDLDAHDRFDALVRDALIEDAERAPDVPEHWPGVTVTASPPGSMRSNPWRLATATAAAAVVLAGTVALVIGQRADAPPAAAPSSWVPDGVEFPATDLGPPASVEYDGPVVAALSRQVSVEGHPPIVVATSLTYMGGATAAEQACTWSDSGGGCRPEWNPSTWSTAVTSSVDNGVAEFDLWTVEGLPSTVAFVTYTVDDETLWQRPVMGFAAFPHRSGPSYVAIGYDVEGSEVSRYGLEEYTAQVVAGDRPLNADISSADLQRLADLTADEMRACLTSRGGVLSGDVATFAAGVDQATVWADCVVEVKSVVGEAVDELDPRFYDPAFERPLHPDPAFHFGD